MSQTITQTDIDEYFAGDKTGYPYPPSNEERFEAWLFLNGYRDIAAAAARWSPEMLKRLGEAATEYAVWLQDNP